MSARTITATLRAGPTPDTVTAAVPPDAPGLDGASLEKFAHSPVAQLPDGSGLEPAGLHLVESGIMPPGEGPWTTVWRTHGDAAAVVGGHLRFTVGDDFDARRGLARAQQRAAELQKQDPSLTSTQAFRRAVAEPEIAELYKAELARRRAT